MAWLSFSYRYCMAWLSFRSFSARRTMLAMVLILSTSGCDRGSRPELVGKPAPLFTVQDSDRKVSLQDFRGQVVVLNFWASWCPPCIEETPSLVAMSQKLRGRVT